MLGARTAAPAAPMLFQLRSSVLADDDHQLVGKKIEWRPVQWSKAGRSHVVA
jgi:hypothetical protein